MPGAIPKPAKIVAIPFPLFQPQFTAPGPSSATPTPAKAETIEYVVDTGHPFLVAIMSQIAEAVSAQTKARSSTPALFLNVDNEMIPFFMVPATLEPARTPPRNSQIAASTVACRRVSDREEIEVANELATLEIS